MKPDRLEIIRSSVNAVLGWTEDRAKDPVDRVARLWAKSCQELIDELDVCVKALQTANDALVIADRNAKAVESQITAIRSAATAFHEAPERHDQNEWYALAKAIWPEEVR